MSKKKRVVAGLIALGYLAGSLYFVSTIPYSTRASVWGTGDSLATVSAILFLLGSDLAAAFVCLGVVITFVADLWEWAFK